MVQVKHIAGLNVQRAAYLLMVARQAKAYFNDVSGLQQGAYDLAAAVVMQLKHIGRLSCGKLHHVRSAGDFVAHKGGFGLGVEAQHGALVQQLQRLFGLSSVGHHHNILQPQLVQGRQFGNVVFAGGEKLGHGAAQAGE